MNCKVLRKFIEEFELDDCEIVVDDDHEIRINLFRNSKILIYATIWSDNKLNRNNDSLCYRFILNYDGNCVCELKMDTIRQISNGDIPEDVKKAFVIYDKYKIKRRVSSPLLPWFNNMLAELEELISNSEVLLDPFWDHPKSDDLVYKA